MERNHFLNLMKTCAHPSFVVGEKAYFYTANDIRNSIFCVTSAVKSRFFIFSSCHDMFADIETKHTFSRLG